MSVPKNQRRRRRNIIGAVTAAILIAAALFIVLQRQTVYDHLSVWQYEPVPAISGLAERTTMTDKGKFYFYASQPVLEGRQEFNERCTRNETQTAILGCYNGIHIVIYDVQDERLDGIREVTAAHEMLHAAYTRMSTAERERIDTLLQKEYDTLETIDDFEERMEYYARTQPGEHFNELHSIIGTEVRNIGDELETYYAQYFMDRQQVIALHESYARVFVRLNDRSEELVRNLDSLNESINRSTDRYNEGVSDLNGVIADFNTRARNEGFASQVQFQAERAALIARADELATLRSSIDRDVARYETLRKELESIASQTNDLNRSLDSSLSPAPSV